MHHLVNYLLIVFAKGTKLFNNNKTFDLNLLLDRGITEIAWQANKCIDLFEKKKQGKNQLKQDDLFGATLL